MYALVGLMEEVHGFEDEIWQERNLSIIYGLALLCLLSCLAIPYSAKIDNLFFRILVHWLS